MALSDVIARLAVSLTLETAAFQEGATIAEKRTAQFQKKMQSLGDSMVGLGSKLSIGVTAPLIAFGATAVQAAQESAEAMGQVDAALASMGDRAGRTSEQLAALADSQMRTSLYDDDEILRKVTTNLLTFGNISGQAFDQAQQAALNLSARLGTDLQSSALMVGKALNDPVKGLTALTRSGVSFTDGQKAQIIAMTEMGDAAGAQAIILGELEKQFGGAAQAMRDTDPAAAAKMEFANLQEEVGERLIPALSKLMEVAVKVLDWFNTLSPAMKDTIVTVGAVVVAVGPMLVAFGSLLPVVTSLGPVLGIVGKALLFIAANPVILALAAVIAGIYLAWKNWDKIEPIIVGLYNTVKNYISDKIGAIMNWFGEKIAWVREQFKKLGDFGASLGIKINASFTQMAEVTDGFADHAEATTVRVAKTFKDMADATLAAISKLTSSVQSGGFLSILESVIGLGLQLGSIGAFGGKIAGRINGVPAAAPRIQSAPSIGGVQTTLASATRTTGGTQRVLVEIADTTGLFVTRVKGQINAAAPAIASAGAQGGVARMAYAGTRRLA